MVLQKSYRPTEIHGVMVVEQLPVSYVRLALVADTCPAAARWLGARPLLHVEGGGGWVLVGGGGWVVVVVGGQNGCVSPNSPCSVAGLLKNERLLSATSLVPLWHRVAIMAHHGV